ncbi:MAG: hypothetical protein LC099_11360 [Anaerolineales bacterium]|nr:hypothetical protein [Anaerolineales bacterium]
MKRALILLFLIFGIGACAPAPLSPPTATPPPKQTSAPTAIPPSATPPPSPTTAPSATPIPPTETPPPTLTPVPTVESLKAVVASEKLICRYGPGANYLYLIAFNQNTPLRLIGRAVGNGWVLVPNEPQKCWVNSQFIALKEAGEIASLPPMYPDGYKIPVSPYYGGTTILSVERTGDAMTVTWAEVNVSAGKYEDENMFPYIVEVWHCVNGEFIFDTLGSRLPFITFADESGCSSPSHGRVYVQEKHGYGGPAEIEWEK